MKAGQEQWLTTGQAASQCSVKPDTVLKWIKRGRLRAERTPGGHYRIRSEDLEPLTLRPEDKFEAPAPNRLPAPSLRCWEHLACGGDPSEECRECIVFRSRAAWCFQMVEVARETGRALIQCQESCDACTCFRRVMGMATAILIVTSDRSLSASLRAEDSDDLRVRVAANGYEASMVIQEFRPAFVVIDREVLRSGDAQFLDRLMEDPRIPRVRVILAAEPGQATRVRATFQRSIVVGVIEKPFAIQDIASVVGAFPVEIEASREAGTSRED